MDRKGVSLGLLGRRSHFAINAICVCTVSKSYQSGRDCIPLFGRARFQECEKIFWDFQLSGFL